MNFSSTWHFIHFFIAWHYECHVYIMLFYDILLLFLLQFVPVLFHFQVFVYCDDPVSFLWVASRLLGEGLFAGAWAPYQRLHH